MLNPLHEPVADFEMKRRQDLALGVMEKAGVEAIIMFNTGDMCGGIAKWLTGVSHYYTLASILCKDCVALFRSGNDHTPDAEIPLTDKGAALPERTWSCPYLPGVTYNVYRYAEAMTYFIREKGFQKIGWAGLAFLPATIYKYLLEHLPDVEFTDITADLDKVRLIQSPYETERFKRCVDLHDRLMDFCKATLRPYMTTHMLDLEILSHAALLGAVEFNTSLIRAWRDDQPLGVHEQLLPGDYIWVLIEVAGKGGEWGECSRTFRLGMEPEQKWIDVSDTLLKIQQAVAKKCVPGAVAEEVFEYCKQLQKEAGYTPETRICIHGQTLDIVDLPVFTKGDKTILQEGMFITIHPGYMSVPGTFNAPYINYTDDFLITKDGAVRLSKTPQEIMKVGI